ncbi:hypothetical protein Val02_29040 [Virgisporangium aliadipatigenens]|uniref:UspA domain-containing protein n=1 Tax=Virgisporangium aliadipatigenens TaxID=741659 RepID=A0A8J4DQR8_9ACTN|nr:universal stress protein [Virgisporangium aliadipatigenens]GIJ46018.1 hypothetical protein Val02_29040 [Virgisporangium aliadipatigenens]
MRSNEIVVGVDGSARSRVALRFAAAEADRHDAALRVVAAYEIDARAERFGPVRSLVRERYVGIVDEALREVANMVPEVVASGAALEGVPGRVLVDAADGARLLVVGNRGLGGFAGLLLGSVGGYVATHARVPVIVVRGGSDTAGGAVVAGLDLSTRDSAVLEAAFAEAGVRGTGLVAVHAYPMPVTAWSAAFAAVPFDPAEVREAAVEEVETALAPWREKYPRVPVEVVVGGGSAARLLVDRSHGAGLVVVGSRGHGVTAGTLLGSVGLQLLHHADSPVLIAH